MEKVAHEHPNRRTRRALAAILVIASSGFSATNATAAPHGGDFALQPYVVHQTSSDPSAVAIGDVTGDGRADVVMTTAFYFSAENDYHVFVFAQDENGALLAPTKVAYGQNRSNGLGNGLALGQFDGNPGLDVAVGSTSAVSVLHATGAPPWLALAEIRGIQRSQALAALDLYGNRRADLVSVGRSDGGTLFENRGTGFFTARRWGIEATDPITLAKGDVDGDGIDDIAAVSYGNTPNIRIYRNARDGRLTEVAALTTGCGFWIAENAAIGDVNGDGINDIVTSGGGNSPDGCVQVFRGLGGARYALPQTFASYDIPRALVAVDINRDGRDDIVVGHSAWAQVGIYLQRADGTLAPEVLFPAPYQSVQSGQNLAVGDFSGDGCPDVAIAGYNGLVTLLGSGCDGIFDNGFERGAR